MIGFSVKEILSSLLNKTKKQTVRSAWKNNKKKPPRFKVGDQAQLVWKPRTKYKLFCSKCGGGIDTSVCGGIRCIGGKEFNKKIGIIEITEVLKVIIKKDKWLGYLIADKKYGKWADSNVNELAWLDGFKSARDMFKLFDKMYDLSHSREFYVYRWRWLD